MIVSAQSIAGSYIVKRPPLIYIGTQDLPIVFSE
jgi:hypothetical protein